MDWVKALVTPVSNLMTSHARVNKEWNANIKKKKISLFCKYKPDLYVVITITISKCFQKRIPRTLRCILDDSIHRQNERHGAIDNYINHRGSLNGHK